MLSLLWLDVTLTVSLRIDLSGEMAAAYDPVAVESAWYSWWEQSGYFKPRYAEDGVSARPEGVFVIPQPPPNVTGALHIGHGMAISLEDTLTRWWVNWQSDQSHFSIIDVTGNGC